MFDYWYLLYEFYYTIFNENILDLSFYRDFSVIYIVLYTDASTLFYIVNVVIFYLFLFILNIIIYFLIHICVLFTDLIFFNFFNFNAFSNMYCYIKKSAKLVFFCIIIKYNITSSLFLSTFYVYLFIYFILFYFFFVLFKFTILSFFRFIFFILLISIIVLYSLYLFFFFK